MLMNHFLRRRLFSLPGLLNKSPRVCDISPRKHRLFSPLSLRSLSGSSSSSPEGDPRKDEEDDDQKKLRINMSPIEVLYICSFTVYTLFFTHHAPYFSVYRPSGFMHA